MLNDYGASAVLDARPQFYKWHLAGRLVARAGREARDVTSERLDARKQHYDFRRMLIQAASGIERFMPDHVEFRFVGLRPDTTQTETRFEGAAVVLRGTVAEDRQAHRAAALLASDPATGAEQFVKRQVRKRPRLR